MARERIRRAHAGLRGTATFARARVWIDRRERLQRPAAVAARWAHRLCFGAAVVVLAGAAEFLALWLLTR